MRVPCLLFVLMGSFAGHVGAQDGQTIPFAVADSAQVLGLEIREKAEQGDLVAQRLAGALLEIAGRDAEAATWYRKAAEQGDASTQGSLGNLYRLGSGVPQNFSEAFKWSKASADQGDPLGQFNLAGLRPRV